MNELSFDEIKIIELNILKSVADFCEQNDIQYSLCYGTMLGAYRHHGFIPWDDDIDIMMPREDYLKFISKYKDKDERYKILSPYEKESVFRFCKVYDSLTIKNEEGIDVGSEIGIDIDIFPVDKFPNSKIFTIIDFHIRNLIGRFYGISIRRIPSENNIKNIFLNPLRKIIKAIGPRRWLYILEYFAQKYNNINKDFAGVRVTTNDGLRDKIPIELFNEYTQLKFEDREFRIIQKPEKYLSIMYGPNYMTPPPESERITHHINKMFLK